MLTLPFLSRHVNARRHAKCTSTGNFLPVDWSVTSIVALVRGSLRDQINDRIGLSILPRDAAGSSAKKTPHSNVTVSRRMQTPTLQNFRHISQQCIWVMSEAVRGPHRDKALRTGRRFADIASIKSTTAPDRNFRPVSILHQHCNFETARLALKTGHHAAHETPKYAEPLIQTLGEI